jgi:hypothetical protein
MKARTVGMVAALVMAGTVGYAAAQQAGKAAPAMSSAGSTGWTFELTPYAWLSGIDADVTAKGQKVKVDQSFSDLINHVDMAGSLMAIAAYDRWEIFTQGDLVSLSDSGTGPHGNSGVVDMDTYIVTGGAGYRFDGPFEGSKIAVLGGARYTRLESQVRVEGLGKTKNAMDVTDALFMLRPSIPLFPSKIDGLRFNPTMNIGAGDSDLTYELQPEIQYNFTETVAGRLGYRRVYYKEKNDNGNEFDGSFSGLLIGLGVTF